VPQLTVELPGLGESIWITSLCHLTCEQIAHPTECRRQINRSSSRPGCDWIVCWAHARTQRSALNFDIITEILSVTRSMYAPFFLVLVLPKEVDFKQPSPYFSVIFRTFWGVFFFRKNKQICILFLCATSRRIQEPFHGARYQPKEIHVEIQLPYRVWMSARETVPFRNVSRFLDNASQPEIMLDFLEIAGYTATACF